MRRLILALILIGLISPTAFAQKPGTWTMTGSMNTARWGGFGATLLLNGKVLVVGGQDANGNTTSSAELYDPSTGIWTPTGSMASPRQATTATLLANGKVLVAGGWNHAGGMSSAEIYDPDTGTWTPTGSMHILRQEYVAASITVGPQSGMVLVTGGDSATEEGLRNAELYNPTTGTWSWTGGMIRGRIFDEPSLATLTDGSVLTVGGYDCHPCYHWLNEAELFSPKTQIWIRTGKKKTGANGRTALLPDGRILVAGGTSDVWPTSLYVATAELFNPARGVWTPTGSMSSDRAYHTLTLLPNAQVLVAGGSSGGWGICNDLFATELYDSSTGSWYSTGNLNAARGTHSATMLPNGQVLVAGGLNCENNALSSAELYTPQKR